MLQRVLAWVGLFVLAATVTVCGDEPAGTEDGSEASGTAAADTAAVFADLDDETPGCAVAVAYPDGEHLADFGMADLDAATPITAATRFDLGSVSKQLTAGAIALLVAQGGLDLETDITELLPDIGPFDQIITVADLVHHTSGLPDYIGLLDADDDEITTTADAIEALVDEDGGTAFAPGTEFQYSNTNYLLLAEIVETVDGRSLVDFTAQEIFEPLGMDRAVVRDDQGVLLDDQAQGYAPDGDGWEPVGSSWRQTGDGAVHASVEDLLAWMALFLDEPRTGTGLGSARWTELMTTPGPLSDDDRAGYGGGLELSTDDGAPVLAHGGSWIGYGSAVVMAPDAGVGVAVACNIDGVDAEDRAAEVLDLWTAS